MGESAWEGARDRANQLGKVLLAVLVDLVFMVAMVLLNWAAQHYVFDIFRPHGVSGTMVDILELAFAVSTVGAVMAFLARDLFVAVTRPWREKPSS